MSRFLFQVVYVHNGGATQSFGLFADGDTKEQAEDRLRRDYGSHIQQISRVWRYNGHALEDVTHCN